MYSIWQKFPDALILTFCEFEQFVHLKRIPSNAVASTCIAANDEGDGYVFNNNSNLPLPPSGYLQDENKFSQRLRWD